MIPEERVQDNIIMKLLTRDSVRTRITNMLRQTHIISGDVETDSAAGKEI